MGLPIQYIGSGLLKPTFLFRCRGHLPTAPSDVKRRNLDGLSTMGQSPPSEGNMTIVLTMQENRTVGAQGPSEVCVWGGGGGGQSIICPLPRVTLN